MQAEVGDDAFDAANADAVACLLEFLGDDFDGSLWIEKAMTDDLADDHFGAAIMGGRAAGFVFESDGSMSLEGVEELEIALLGEAVLERGLGGADAFALAFEKHGEFEGDFIVMRDGDGAGWTDQGTT